MKKVFIVRLTEAERSELDVLVRKGKASALRQSVENDLP